MDRFTPVSSTLGGLLIGISAAGLLLLTGRIAGISGVLGGLVAPSPQETKDRGWRLFFLAGLLLGGLVFGIFTGRTKAPVAPIAVVGVAGVLVGFGTRLGSGCTSGHGVCGIGRLSKRSIVATGVFMATGMATVFLTRHLLGMGR